MGLVLGLKFYKDKNILKILDYINKEEEYMVMMAEAWLIATIAITYPNEIYEFLKKTPLSTLKLKAISKIKESYRISDEMKEKFVSLRKISL